IVPMSDEGPEDGDPVNDPGDDRDAITAAIAAARANNVIVSPVLGSGFSSGTENLARDLANGTGGRVFLSSDPSQDLADGVANLIGTAACTPIITAVAPECDVASGTIVTITGANFLPGATVTIGGFVARDVTVISSTQIQCRIDPATPQGTYDVRVTNPPGGWSFSLPHALTVGPCEAGCEVPRPEVSPVCPGPDYVRNGYYESGPRSWGQLSSTGRGLIDSDLAPQGFFAAHFVGPMGLAADEWLYQYIEVPPDATGASFWVDDEAHGVSKVASPPAATGLDFFRVSLYDLTLGREVVRLWEFDPLSQCPIDSPAYNLTVAELDLIRGHRVALALRLRKVTTTGWATLVVVDGVHFTVCAPSPPCRVVNDKTAAPRVVRGGDEVTVMLSLTGVEGACLVQRQAADVALVVDRSGSMSGQKMWDAKSAAKAFVDRLQLSRDQVALVSFADSAALDSGLTRTAGPVRGAVDRLNAAGSTNIEEALRMAQAELASGRRVAANQPVLILMSDGRP
ncbi:MAG: VWA domain-containing protein, partial [Anaerolineae bacterium]